MPLTSAAVDALRDATMTETTLTLPQVGSKAYAELKKVIERTGGRWVRKLGTHVYDVDPRPIIAEIIETGDMPRDASKDAAFFRTPPEIAEKLVYYAGLLNPAPMRVLEPSAGDGALADAAREVYPWRVLDLVCVEPDAGRHATLVGKGHKAEQTTFEDFAASEPEPFDSVLMNPPFATPGEPVLWAKHVLLAWELVKPGGSLAAVIPSNLDRPHKAVAAVRALVESYGHAEDVPDGAFKVSGTGVSTKLIVIEKS
jgi:hypothetical protein